MHNHLLVICRIDASFPQGLVVFADVALHSSNLVRYRDFGKTHLQALI
jgi:hypothetical protein